MLNQRKKLRLSGIKIPLSIVTVFQIGSVGDDNDLSRSRAQIVVDRMPSSIVEVSDESDDSLICVAQQIVGKRLKLSAVADLNFVDVEGRF